MSDALPDALTAVPPPRDRRIVATAAISVALHMMLLVWLVLPRIGLPEPAEPPAVNVDLVPPPEQSSLEASSSMAPSSQVLPSSTEAPSSEAASSAWRRRASGFRAGLTPACSCWSASPTSRRTRPHTTPASSTQASTTRPGR